MRRSAAGFTSTSRSYWRISISKAARSPARAAAIRLDCSDKWYEHMTIKDMLSPRVLFALDMAGKPLPEALHGEWERSKSRIGDALEGAGRFASGEGRHGKF